MAYGGLGFYFSVVLTIVVLAYLARWSVESSPDEYLGRAPEVASYLQLSYVRCTVLLINALAGRESASDFGLR